MIKHIPSLNPLLVLAIFAAITTAVGLYVLAHVVKSLKPSLNKNKLSSADTAAPAVSHIDFPS